MTWTYKVIDLADCDREPIHIPSAVQPHGTLLVVEPASGRIIQVGMGLEGLLPLSSPPLGQRLTDVLGVPAALMESAVFSREPVYIGSLVAELAAGYEIDITVHRSHGLIIIELERALISNI